MSVDADGPVPQQLGVEEVASHPCLKKVLAGECEAAETAFVGSSLLAVVLWHRR